MIVDISIPDKESVHTGRVLLKPETANVIRKLSKHLGISLDELVQRMLSEWIPRNTNLTLTTKKDG